MGAAPPAELADRELLKLNRYLFKALPIQATRGCPYRCSFCEIPVFYGGTFRTRPVGEIVEEIEQNIKIAGFRSPAPNVRPPFREGDKISLSTGSLVLPF